MIRQAIEALKKLKHTGNEIEMGLVDDLQHRFGWNAAIDAVLALEDEPLAGAELTYAVNKKSDGDYPEDFPHENGNYFRVCADCDNHFTSHKRRLICKLCAQPAGDARKALDALDDIGLSMHSMTSHPPSMPADYDAALKAVYNFSEKILHIHRDLSRALTPPPKIEGLDEAIEYVSGMIRQLNRKPTDPLNIILEAARQSQAVEDGS